MANYKRSERVSDLIRTEISGICSRQLRDPRIGVITITDVRLSDDLKIAKVYFVKMGEDFCAEETLTAIKKAQGFVRRELGQRLRLRTVPELIFTFDESFAYSSRIENIIKELKIKENEDLR